MSLHFHDIPLRLLDANRFGVPEASGLVSSSGSPTPGTVSSWERGRRRPSTAHQGARHPDMGETTGSDPTRCFAGANCVWPGRARWYTDQPPRSRRSSLELGPVARRYSYFIKYGGPMSAISRLRERIEAASPRCPESFHFFASDIGIARGAQRDLSTVRSLPTAQFVDYISGGAERNAATTPPLQAEERVLMKPHHLLPMCSPLECGPQPGRPVTPRVDYHQPGSPPLRR